MDHPISGSIEFIPASPKLFENCGFYDMTTVHGVPGDRPVMLRQDALRREKLLNSSIVLCPRTEGYRSRGIEALRRFKLNLRRKKVPPDSWRDARDLMVGTPDLIRYAIRAYRGHTQVGHGWSTYPDG
jgi:hypothetical protein